MLFFRYSLNGFFLVPELCFVSAMVELGPAVGRGPAAARGRRVPVEVARGEPGVQIAHLKGTGLEFYKLCPKFDDKF